MNSMLLQHFRLRDQPFAVTPDPRFLYESETHREALASLLYGINSDRGFLALIGKPGMGKTTLLFRLLEHYRHQALTAFLFQTQCEWREFLSYLFADLGIKCEDANDLVTMHQRLNRVLGEQARLGRFCLVVIDEAQNLDNRALETVRLLSDFETSRTKLLQIVLAGQPSFEDKLADPSLLQLRQRLSMICRLSPLGEREVNEYIDHRLRMAGHNGAELFTAGAREDIARLGEGIPRVISNICFNSMSLAFATGQKLVTREHVNEVASDLTLAPGTAELTPHGASAGKSQSRIVVPSREGSLSPANNTHPVQDTGSTGKLPLVPQAAPLQSAEELHSAQASAGFSGESAPAENTRGTVIHHRTSRRGGDTPTLRIVERAVFALAGVAIVLALVMWFFGHRPMNINRLLSNQGAAAASVGTEAVRRESDSNKVRVPLTRPTTASRRIANDSGSRDVRGQDNAPPRVSQDADTNRTRSTISPPVSEAKNGNRELQQRKLALVNASTLTHAPVIERNASTPSVRAGGPVFSTPVTVTRMVKPVYPEAAKSASIQGLVTLQALVDTEGLVRDVKVLDGDPALTRAAVQAVSQWQYRPHREDGTPVMFQTIIRIRFTLDENPPES